MNKKSISVIILILFMALSCYRTRIERVETILSENKKQIRILSVLTASGEFIKFYRRSPGRLLNDKISGLTIDKAGRLRYISVPFSEVDLVWMKKVSLERSLLQLSLVVGILAVITLARMDF